MKNGILVGGCGLAVGQKNDGQPLFDSVVDIAGNQLFTTGYYPNSQRRTWQPAAGWKNVPGMGEKPLEIEAPLNFWQAWEEPAPATWYVLARQSGENGYDNVTLSLTRDFNDAFCTLKVNEWSKLLRTSISMKNGAKRGVSFHCKLIELSEDAQDFRLYVTCLFADEGWCSPPEISQQINSQGLAGSEMMSLVNEWFDYTTWTEINSLYTEWHTETAITLLTKNDWDAFFMHYHTPDWTYHYIINYMDPDLTKDKSMNDLAWGAHLEMCKTMDGMLEKIIAVLPNDTLVILVSDHGAVADYAIFDPLKALEAAGLTKLSGEKIQPLYSEEIKGFRSEDEKATGATGMIEEIKLMGRKADSKNSKAVPLQTSYVYINLKGRDPDGIVDPADYANVQREIIDVLSTYIDPETSLRPVSIALSKNDARLLGVYGDDCGDVVYAVHPYYGMSHGNILPTAEWGVGSTKNLIVLNGPNIKRGFRLKRTSRLVDLVPTICYLLKWPIPEHAEGAVLYQALEDRSFALK